MDPVALSALPVAGFLERLAADQPAPGGGAAAALAGALAAGLAGMVGRHTLGRPRYAAVEQRIAELLAEADQLRHGCQRLMDADAEAFQAVSAGYKLAKEDPDRPARIQAGLRQATEVPLELMRACRRIRELAEEMGRIGNQTLAGDATSAGILAQAAARASAVNVGANCAALDDRAYAEAALAEMARLLGEA